MENNKDSKLNELEKLEREQNSSTPIEDNKDNSEEREIPEKEIPVKEIPVKAINRSNSIIDGYNVVERESLPFAGVYYPEDWKFAYRCPKSDEIANFSTVNEQDQPAVMTAISDLVQKCFIIVDSSKGTEISTTEINDGERLFFFLLLREVYMQSLPIKFTTINLEYQEPVEVNLFANSLVYKQPNAKLLECYDGRKFTIPVNGIDEPIVFLMPTLEISSRIFRYIIKTYREAQKENAELSKENEAFDKKFLLVAPFLYERGNEKIEELKAKYRKISKNGNLLNAYITVINKLSLTNAEYIEYQYKGSWEETQIKFPGGWRNMFIDTKIFGGIFD